MRRLYKLLSWDYPNNEGQATDVTKFDGQPFVFTFHARLSESGRMLFAIARSGECALLPLCVRAGRCWWSA